MEKKIVRAVLFMSFVSSALAHGKKFQGLLKFVTYPPTRPNAPYTIYDDPDQLYTDYIYGDCTKNKELILQATAEVPYNHLRGKVIQRGWLDLYNLPSCIILRSTAFEEETYRATAFNFQICVVRLTYIHTRRTWRYYYYEWYIPHDISGLVNWKIFFYSNQKRDP